MWSSSQEGGSAAIVGKVSAQSEDNRMDLVLDLSQQVNGGWVLHASVAYVHSLSSQLDVGLSVCVICQEHHVHVQYSQCVAHTSLLGAGFCFARRTGEGKREDSPTRGREQRQLSWYVRTYVCMYVCMYIGGISCSVSSDRQAMFVPTVYVYIRRTYICMYTAH